MAWLIMNDEVNYKTEFFPTHILGFNNEIIPVYIGASSVIEDKAIGIYVSDEDYKKMDHSKEYVLIHDPDLYSKVPSRYVEDGSKLYEVLKELSIGDVEDISTINRYHYHVW